MTTLEDTALRLHYNEICLCVALNSVNVFSRHWFHSVIDRLTDAHPSPPTSASSSISGRKSGLHFSNFIISRMFEYFPATATFSSPSGTQWLEFSFIIVPQALGSVNFFQSIFYYSGWVISVILFSASLILSSVLFLGLIHWAFISVITFLSSKNFHLVLLRIFCVFAETCYFVAEAF